MILILPSGAWREGGLWVPRGDPREAAEGWGEPRRDGHQNHPLPLQPERLGFYV